MVYQPSIKHPEELHAAITQYGLGRSLVKRRSYLGGIANENYWLDIDGEEFVLKIIRDQPSAQKITTEVIYQNLLRANDIPVAVYETTISHKAYCLVNGNLGVLTRKVNGSSPNRINSHLLVDVAQILAQIHLINPDGLPRRNSWFNTNTIHNQLELIRQYAPPKDVAIFESLYHEFDEAQFAQLPQSIVHADLFPDNLVVDEQKLIAVIDWERVDVQASLFDLAMTIFGFCLSPYPFSRTDYAKFIEHYSELRPLSQPEQALLPQAYFAAVFTLAAWRFLQFNYYHPISHLSGHFRSALKFLDRDDIINHFT